MTTSPAEFARDQLALAQAAERQAFRASLEARMVGDDGEYVMLFDRWLPLMEFGWDMQTSPVPEIDSVVRNQDVDFD